MSPSEHGAAHSPDALVQAARAAGVRDQRLLAAMRKLPRAAFVPAELAGSAYLDQPLRIPHGQVTTQPSLVARMIEGLALAGREKVLEVGTGYGYQTALLARLAREVWSVELWPDITAAARSALQAQGIANVRLVVGDGTLGLPEQAPFEAILLSAAFPKVPQPLIEQLAEAGRLVQPIGPGGRDRVMVFEKQREALGRGRSLAGAYFVPLYGKHGYAFERQTCRQRSQLAMEVERSPMQSNASSAQPEQSAADVEPARQPTDAGARARVLIVAHRTAATPRLLAAVGERARRSRCAFTLLVPRPYWDPDTEEAAATLELAIPLLEAAAGGRVEGIIGESDPLAAVHDAVSGGRFDEVIVSTLPAHVSRWLRRDLPHRVEELGLPVTVVSAEQRSER